MATGRDKYGVHLAQCSAVNCPCDGVIDRLASKLTARGLIIANGRTDYPLLGLHSEHLIDFATRSHVTVIPLCRAAADSTNFNDWYETVDQPLRRRFIVALSELTTVPGFLDIRPIPLYHFHETTELNRLVDRLDRTVTDQSCRNAVAIPNAPGRPPVIGQNPVSQPFPTVPGTPPHRPRPLSNILEFENSSSSYSDGLSVYVDNSQFVCLPSLDPVDPHHPDSGPIVRGHCTEIVGKAQFEKDLQHDLFHRTFNFSEELSEKRDAILFGLQTFDRRTLQRPLHLAVQILKCKHAGLRQHGLSYIECSLLRWNVLLSGHKFEQLRSTEDQLFELLEDDSECNLTNIADFPRMCCVYVLCLALLRSQLDQPSPETYTDVRKLLKERLFSINECIAQKPQNQYYKALQKILHKFFDKRNGSVRQILRFQKALKDFHQDPGKTSLQTLKEATRFPSRSVFNVLREARKTERMLVRQIMVRAIVVWLKDKCGKELYVASEEMESQCCTRLVDLLPVIVNVGTRATTDEWQLLLQKELEPLLIHENSDVVSRVQQIVNYATMSQEQKDEVTRNHFSRVFSAVGLEWLPQSRRDLSDVLPSQRWRYAVGRIGGSKTDSLVSIIYNPYKDSEDCSVMYNSGFQGDVKCKNECKILTNLNPHPLIAQLLAVQHWQGILLYVLEMPSKISLQKHLLDRRAQGNWLSLQELTDLALMMIQAIEYCHSEGVIHRDIRTESFFYCKSKRQVKLSNFGLGSRFKDNHVDTDVQMEEVPALWSSPETLRDGQTSCWSDIWMLGQSLYELYTHGCWPYTFQLKTTRYLDVVKWVACYGIKPVEPPECIPEKVFSAILSCLAEEYERPTATSLRTSFHEIQQQQRMNAGMIPDLNMTTMSYMTPSDFQLKRNSKAEMGVPIELTHFDDLPSVEEIVPDPWKQEFIEDDDPEINYMDEKIVIKECPMYVHTADEVKGLMTNTSGMVRLTEHKKMAGGSTLESEWTCSGNKTVTLSQFLWTSRVDGDSYLDLILQIFTDVTDSLSKLHKNRCIHRDICCKHILVDPVTNHGCIYRLARVKYIRRNLDNLRSDGFQEELDMQQKFSRRRGWFPLEVLQTGYYSLKSDVYMLAVTVWDTLNKISNRRKRRRDEDPFEEIPQEKLAEYLTKGNILPQPDCCPAWLYCVLRDCWTTTRLDRPSMAHVHRCLVDQKYIATRKSILKISPRRNVFSTADVEDLSDDEETDLKTRPASSGANCGPAVRFGDNPNVTFFTPTRLPLSSLPTSQMRRISGSLSGLTQSPGRAGQHARSFRADYERLSDDDSDYHTSVV